MVFTPSRLAAARKTIALAMALCLLWTSGGIAESAAAAPDVFAVPTLPLPFNLTPPGALGRIADYYSSPTPGSKLVILIQDLHAHYGVQKNIAGILDFLASRLSSPAVVSGGSINGNMDPGLRPAGVTVEKSIPFAVGVEGAEGPVDSSVMALFPDQKIKQQAADYLMREGELTGAEYFAVMRGIPNLLTGVENGEYYNINRELFRKTLADRQELVGLLKAIQTDIQPLEGRLYGSSLKTFQKILAAGDNGTLSRNELLAELLHRSAALQVNWKSDFPELAHYAMTAEALPAPEQLRRAATDFLSQSQNVFSREEQQTVAALAKQSNSTEYYLYLRDLLFKHQLFLAAPLELSRYLEYVHASTSMDMDHIQYEMQELSFRLEMQIATAGPEKDLVQVEHDLALLIRVADLQSTEQEVKAFGPRMNQFLVLCQTLMTSNGISSFDETRVSRLISSSIDYYAMALLRNRPMIDRTLALLGKSDVRPEILDARSQNSLTSHVMDIRSQVRHQPDVAVLVTGGFHTESLTELLRARNVSYIVITPTVDSLTDADHDLYIKRLSGDLLTVDQVLADAKNRSKTQLAKPKMDANQNGLAVGLFGAGLAGSVTVAALYAGWARSHGFSIDPSHLNLFLSSFSSWVQLHTVSSAVLDFQNFFAAHHAIAAVKAALILGPTEGIRRLKTKIGQLAAANQNRKGFFNIEVWIDSDENGIGKSAFVRVLSDSLKIPGWAIYSPDDKPEKKRGEKGIWVRPTWRQVGTQAQDIYTKNLGEESLVTVYLSETEDPNQLDASLQQKADFIIDSRSEVMLPPEQMAALWAEPSEVATTETMRSDLPEQEVLPLDQTPGSFQLEETIRDFEWSLKQEWSPGRVPVVVHQLESLLKNLHLSDRAEEQIEKTIELGQTLMNSEVSRSDLRIALTNFYADLSDCVGILKEDPRVLRQEQLSAVSMPNPKASGRYQRSLEQLKFLQDGETVKVSESPEGGPERRVVDLGFRTLVQAGKIEYLGDGDWRIVPGKFLTMGWAYRFGDWLGFSARETEKWLAPIVEAPIVAVVAVFGWGIPSLEKWFIARHPGKDPASLHLGIHVIRYSMFALFLVYGLAVVTPMDGLSSFNSSGVRDWFEAILGFFALSIPGHMIWNWSDPDNSMTMGLSSAKNGRESVGGNGMPSSSMTADPEARVPEVDEVARLETLRDAIDENRVGRTANIFDLHGNPEMLDYVIKLVEDREIDEVIFHGDAFDRGSENRDVFEKLKKLDDLLGDKFVILFGNHDVWMIQALMLGDLHALSDWITHDDLVFKEAGFDPLRDHLRILLKNRSERNKREANQLLQGVLRGGWKINGIREMARWMLAHQRFHFVDSHGILHVHAGIPLDENGRIKAGFELADLQAADLQLQKIRTKLADPHYVLRVDEQQASRELFERMSDIFWIRENQWVDRLLVHKEGTYQMDQKRLQFFLDAYDIQGVMFGHNHQLTNMDNRLFGGDLDSNALIIHDHEGITLRTRKRDKATNEFKSTDDLLISKREILARIDQEIVRKAGAIRDITIAAEGDEAPLHDTVNNNIDTFRTKGDFSKLSKREMKIVLELIRKKRPDFARTIEENGYVVFLYGNDQADFLAEDIAPDGSRREITTHAGIGTGAIHLSRGEYNRLIARGKTYGKGLDYLAGRIAHEAVELNRWRQEAVDLRLKPQAVRVWIKANFQTALKLHERFHMEGLRLEQDIAGKSEGADTSDAISSQGDIVITSYAMENDPAEFIQGFDSVQPDHKNSSMSTLGQLGVGLVALFNGDGRGAWEEWKAGGDILFKSGKKSLHHQVFETGAVKLMLENLLKLEHVSADVQVEMMDHPRWGQAMTMERTYESGTLVAVKVLINPDLSVGTLRRGAVRQMFRALEPAPHGLGAKMEEEINVTRRTRLFLAQYDSLLQRTVLAAEQSIRESITARIVPTPAQLDGQDDLFTELWKMISETKADKVSLDAARRSIIVAA